jgi:hypothetical protein
MELASMLMVAVGVVGFVLMLFVDAWDGNGKD